MATFAYDFDDAVPAAPRVAPRSEMRLRTPYGCTTEMAEAANAVELAARDGADRSVVLWLRMVQRAAAELEQRTRLLGADHVTKAWLEASLDWFMTVSGALVSAFSYEGAERHVALELAAEESSMRLLMGLEREGTEAASVLRNLDGGTARAAGELAACIDLADRMLHALGASGPQTKR
jgi:hypothetical protein